MIVELGGHNGRVGDVQVSSAAGAPVVVQVAATRVMAPGQDDEQLTALSELAEPGLQVLPARFVLHGGAQQTLRFVALGAAPEQDRIYRVLVTPEPPAGETADGPLDAYDLLVMVRPSRPGAALQASRSGTTLTLRNAGNSNVLIQDGRQCDRHERCQALPSYRIHAGASVEVPLPDADDPVRYLMVGPLGSRLLSY